jgi:hypothetical protein
VEECLGVDRLLVPTLLQGYLASSLRNHDVITDQLAVEAIRTSSMSSICSPTSSRWTIESSQRSACMIARP